MKTGLVTILYVLSLAALIATAAQATPRETVLPEDRTLGKADAPVVVIEYLAPMCPYCASFAADVFPELKRDYIDTGKVLYVIRILPLGAPDGAVAGMAKCMPPDRYYEFLDLAFQKQELWDPDGHEIPDVKAALLQLGGLAGLKPDEAKHCMEDNTEFERIDRLAQDGMDRYHVEAVPSLIIDGKVVAGSPQTWPAIKAQIDVLVAQAAMPSPAQPAAKVAVHKQRPHQPTHHPHHAKKARHPVKKSHAKAAQKP